MTENTEIPVAAREPLPTLDLIAFLGALILAPVMATAMTFYLVIPIGALVMGGPLFVVVGGPILLVMAHYRPLTPKRSASAAFATVLVGILALAPIALMNGEIRSIDTAMIFCIFALIFAPFWGAIFGWLYRSFHSPRRSLTPAYQ